MWRYVRGIFIFGLCSFLLAGRSIAASSTNTASPAGFTDQQIIQAWGWLMARQNDLAEVELSAPELSAFLKGFAANLKNQPPPYDLQKSYPDVERLAKARREKLVAATTQKNEDLARTFFTALKRDTNVIGLPDGLRYEVLRSGTGAFPQPQQTVTVHYTGRLIDGTEFVQMENYDVVFVTNRLSLSLFAGIQKTRKGGAIKLYVPPPLPEGDALRLGIPPGSAMVYDIEVLDLKETSPEDLANALLPPAPEPEAPPPSGFSDLQLMETWGWTVAQETRAVTFGLNDAEISSAITGLSAGIKGQASPYEMRKMYPEVEKLVTSRQEKFRLATQQKRLAEMNALFASLKKNTNVVELPDGLRYEILKPGSGPYPKPGQIVLVDYTAQLINGTVFDKTYNEPLNLEVGTVTPGWDEAIQKVNKGGRIKFYLPPSLGYGDVQVSGVVAAIPAHSTLIYELELLDIKVPTP